MKRQGLARKAEFREHGFFHKSAVFIVKAELSAIRSYLLWDLNERIIANALISHQT